MNTNELKLSWKNSTWTLNGGEDIGPSIVPSMKILINLLSALKTGGFTVSQVVLEGTSIKSLDALCASTRTIMSRLQAARLIVISQTCGSTSNQSKTTSKESQPTFYESSVGSLGQITTSGYLEAASSPISTQTEARSNTTKSGTTTDIEDLLSLKDAVQSVTDWNAFLSASATCYSQRGLGIPSFSEWLEYLQSQYLQLRQEQCSGEWSTIVANTGSSSSAAETGMTQETN